MSAMLEASTYQHHHVLLQPHVPGYHEDLGHPPCSEVPLQQGLQSVVQAALALAPWPTQVPLASTEEATTLHVAQPFGDHLHECLS